MSEPVDVVPDTTLVDVVRHTRQIALPNVGVAGQARLRRARVLLVGAGGLGSPAALYLAAAGVGHLGLVDPDRVALHNLQRQLLHTTADLGRLKVESARDRLHALDPRVDVATYDTRLTAANALDLIGGYDVVVDGSDNLRTRYLTSDACVQLGVPNVYGAVFRFDGQATVLATRDGPCYRCLFPVPPPPGTTPSCEASGVLGVLPGLVGTIQATETLKLLLGIGEPLIGRLLLVDGLRMDFRSMRVRRDLACPACGVDARRDAPLLDEMVDDPCEDTERDAADEEISPRELAGQLARGEDVQLIDVREPWEFAIAQLPGARLVRLGTLDASAVEPGRAVVVYCHHGARGQRALARLRAAGVARVTNLAGGIDRWSEEVDSAVPRY
ncbi:MAG: molybdopterin-synthase adenylyltransferase MoeB [Candidatus Eremiobacteraeota bacterium]|nr:molybdopterin-synthase adenylyltransferase MoeB [Candidatus Eremiobacteraeota bacterium]